MAKAKRKTRKVGSSWTVMKKVNGKRRKVRRTKVGKGKYKDRVIGSKARRKTKRKVRRTTKRKSRKRR
jgi:hypothetical protein